jgi:hypothetical protein
LELMLEGEMEPLLERVGRYELLEEEGGNGICIHDIRTSLKWIDTLAKNYLE